MLDGAARLSPPTCPAFATETSPLRLHHGIPQELGDWPTSDKPGEPQRRRLEVDFQVCVGRVKAADCRMLVCMTTTAGVDRSGPAIRAALASCAPEECERFEAEFRDAATRAADTLDLPPVEVLLDRWWGIATARMHPLTSEEREAVARVKAGDDRGLLARDGAGHWVRV